MALFFRPAPFHPSVISQGKFTHILKTPEWPLFGFISSQNTQMASWPISGFLGKCPVWQTGHFARFLGSHPSYFHDSHGDLAENRFGDYPKVEQQAREHNLQNSCCAADRLGIFCFF
jgi:hypothetical protein